MYICRQIVFFFSFRVISTGNTKRIRTNFTSLVPFRCIRFFFFILVWFLVVVVCLFVSSFVFVLYCFCFVLFFLIFFLEGGGYVFCFLIDGHFNKSYKMSTAREPDRRSNFVSSPAHLHVCAFIYVTEISLIVTLSNQYSLTPFPCLIVVWFSLYSCLFVLFFFSFFLFFFLGGGVVLLFIVCHFEAYFFPCGWYRCLEFFMTILIDSLFIYSKIIKVYPLNLKENHHNVIFMYTSQNC